MLIKDAPSIPASEITDEKLYVRRREFIRLVGGAAVAAGVNPWLQDSTRLIECGHPECESGSKNCSTPSTRLLTKFDNWTTS